jgi:hypothetical protein
MEMWHNVVWEVHTNILEEHTSFIFRIENIFYSEGGDHRFSET